MQTFGWATFFQHLDRVERPLCALANTLANVPPVHRLFVFVSKLGDGPAWVMLFIAIGLTMPDAGNLPAVLIATCVFNLLLYKLIKGQTLRNRPCTTWEAINPVTPPLDHYSFPSGHTLHAVSITLIVLPVLPLLGLLLVPLTVLIMLSRVILGLHYPSDVLIATAIGWMVASVAGLFVAI
jgi:undecaprenyl-diphosphatase